MALPAEQITSWSFSRWNTYNECPFKAKLKFINKLKEPSTPALERGTALHTLCEDYLNKGGRVPKELQLIEKTLKELRKAKAIAEGNFIFTQKWEPTVWNDWNGAWLRAKADAVIPPIVDSKEPTVQIDDFKSGKLKEEAHSDYMLQLDLYSLVGLLTYPTAEYANSRLIFIDHGKNVENENVWTRGDIPMLQKQWLVRIQPMMKDKSFKPKPGNYCRYCHFRAGNGGPCKY